MAMENYASGVAERLMRYVKVYTESDANSPTQPSTERQKDLGRMLVQELRELGIEDAELDAYGYVYATIPSSVNEEVPVLCFCAHMDTTADVTGKDVRPLLHRNYTGEPIVLPDDPSIVITVEEHPYLKERVGDDLITASGTTLLGADDKAGIAIIMDLARHLMENPELRHGKIRILFTPDEEIGRGVDAIDMKKLGADFGYTLDGGARGSLEGESFSADGALFVFEGVSAHPGYAKNKLVNALKVAAHFVSSLPGPSWSPELTSGREGFVHPLNIQGGIEKATVQFIVRDFETAKLKEYEQRLEKLAQEAVSLFPGSAFRMEITEQYRNMREVLDGYPQVMDHAEKAYRQAGLEPKVEVIRGGTDGSRLSFMGLPCPNIFTGEMAIHSKKEYVSVQDMEKAVEVLVHLSRIWSEER
jgi:tripeptide aminopeptidase